jgi:hypothetical protein
MAERDKALADVVARLLEDRDNGRQSTASTLEEEISRSRKVREDEAHTMTYADVATNVTSDMVEIIEKLGNIDKDVASAPGVMQTNTIASGGFTNNGKARDFSIGKYYFSEIRTPGGKDIASMLRNLDRIEAKSNCTIVKILDNIANYMEKSVTSIRKYAMHISTPCSIVKKPSWFAGWVLTK